MRDDGQTFHDNRTPKKGMRSNRQGDYIQIHTITLFYVFKTHFVKKKREKNTWYRKTESGGHVGTCDGRARTDKFRQLFPHSPPYTLPSFSHRLPLVSSTTSQTVSLCVYVYPLGTTTSSHLRPFYRKQIQYTVCCLFMLMAPSSPERDCTFPGCYSRFPPGTHFVTSCIRGHVTPPFGLLCARAPRQASCFQRSHKSGQSDPVSWPCYPFPCSLLELFHRVLPTMPPTHPFVPNIIIPNIPLCKGTIITS